MFLQWSVFLRRIALIVCASSVAWAPVSRGIEPEPALDVPLAVQAVFLDIAQAGERVVAVGERGIVVYSDDQGTTWTQADVPVRGTLTALEFQDPRNGFAVGHDATILRTKDGGESWNLVKFDPESQNVFLNVRFRTPQWGYIVGTNGQLLITRDGGVSWDSQTLAVEEWYQNHLFDIAWTDAGTLVVAEKGVLYFSHDGLDGWDAVESPYEGSYFGTVTLDSGDVVLYGMSGRVYLGSTERGWTQVPTGTEQFLYDAQVLPDGRVLVVGAGGVHMIVDPDTATAQVGQRLNRGGLIGLLVDNERVIVALEGGGLQVLALGEFMGN